MTNKAIILLSGGLDSLTALGYIVENKFYDVKLALTFDYGQKAANCEIEASKSISEYYNIEHKVIKLDWLKEITNTALVSEAEVPDSGYGTKESAEKVWVPNRNGLFLNIAAAYCDAYEYKYIIYGANSDEGATFSDNTEKFRLNISMVFESSTLAKPMVVAPLINYGKDDIVKIAVENKVPLELVRSCYNSGKVHCGKCESCYHLKKALKANHCEEYIKLLFGNEN